jgi:hypothetical protein
MCVRAGLVKEISFGISLFQLVNAAVNNSRSFRLEQARRCARNAQLLALVAVEINNRVEIKNSSYPPD